MPGGMKESSFEIRGVSSGSSGQERRFSISDQELYGSSVAQRNLFLVNLLLPVYRVSGRRIESPFSLVSRASGRAIRPRNVNVRFPVSSRKEWIRSIRGREVGREGWGVIRHNRSYSSGLPRGSGSSSSRRNLDYFVLIRRLSACLSAANVKQ